MLKHFLNMFGKKPTYPKRILFISSPTSSIDNEDTYDYFASITSELAIRLQNRYGDLELVLKVPENGIKANEQQTLFIENAINSVVPFECIIVSPADRDNLYPKMKPWIEKYGKNKIILIDQGYTLDEFPHFHSTEVSRPPYVQADWKGGGKVAAESMIKYFNKNNINCPHVVLMKGSVGSEQRIKGFRELMSNQTIAKCQTSYYECEGQYSKKSARENFEKYLLNCISSTTKIDGIFATNDEMALGIQDALYKNRAKYTSAFSHLPNNIDPIIIGFDGIRDLTILIDKHDDFIYDTVNVQLKKQIASLTNIIEKLIMKNERIPDKEKFVDMNCVSYRMLKNMPI